MKKFVSGLILAVVVTPALAENEVGQPAGTPSMLQTSSYSLEVKEGENTLTTQNFAAIDNRETKVASWNLESNPSDRIEAFEVTSGFEITLHPVPNSGNFMDIYFEYRQPINQKKQEHVYKFETGITLAKGGSFCSELSGTGEKINFCLSRN